MSIPLLNRAFEATCASGGEKAVLLALADRADDDGKCWSSVADVMSRASISQRHVSFIFRRLEHHGHLTIEHRKGARNLFRIHPSTPAIIAGVGPVPTPAMVAGDPCYNSSTPLLPSQETPATIAPEPPLTTNEPPMNHHGVVLDGEKRPPPKKPKAPAPEPPLDPVPVVLDTPEFHTAWTEWMLVRRRMKKPGSWTIMFNAQLKRLAKNPVTAVAMLEQSVSNGWVGLFEVKQESQNTITRYQKQNPELYRNSLMGGDDSPVVGPPGFVPRKPK